MRKPTARRPTTLGTASLDAIAGGHADSFGSRFVVQTPETVGNCGWCAGVNAILNAPDPAYRAHFDASVVPTGESTFDVTRRSLTGTYKESTFGDVVTTPLDLNRLDPEAHAKAMDRDPLHPPAGDRAGRAYIETMALDQSVNGAAKFEPLERWRGYSPGDPYPVSPYQMQDIGMTHEIGTTPFEGLRMRVATTDVLTAAHVAQDFGVPVTMPTNRLADEPRMTAHGLHEHHFYASQGISPSGDQIYVSDPMRPHVRISVPSDVAQNAFGLSSVGDLPDALRPADVAPEIHARAGVVGARAAVAGLSGGAAGVVFAGLEESREWRDANLPAAVNQVANFGLDVAKVAADGPAPVFPVGAWVQERVANVAAPLVGRTAANIAGAGIGGVVDVAAMGASLGVYGAYNLGAVALNTLKTASQDPALRQAALVPAREEAAQAKYWEGQAFSWAAERGDQGFTIGDAQRTADDMRHALRDPAGAGISVYTPDGRVFERSDPNYSDAMSSLVGSGRYTAEDLSGYTPDQVVQLSNEASTPTTASTIYDDLSDYSGYAGATGEQAGNDVEQPSLAAPEESLPEQLPTDL